MRRLWRVLVCGLALAACLALATVAVRSYLASPQARAQLTSRLETAYGGPVSVAEVQVGLQRSSVAQVQLYEPKAEAGDPPWAVIPQVQADVSVLDLLRRTALPQALTLFDAAVTLRFDAEGHLLTRFPTTASEEPALPAVHFKGGQLTLRQEGRPDLVLTGITADLHDQGEHLLIEGTVTNSDWGTWSFQGSFDHGRAGVLTLKTPHVHVTQAMLDRLPFVAPKVWREVQVEGETPVEFILRREPQADKMTTRIALEPTATQVHIPSIDLRADQAQGQVVIEDEVVQLRNVRGQTAGGAIQTSGELNFRDPPSQLRFAVAVHGLELARLPQSWSLPPQIQGRLTGQANLQVTLLEGKATTQGEGQGVIHEARVAGLPAQPIHLALHAADSRFHFSSPPPAALKSTSNGPLPALRGDEPDAPAKVGLPRAAALGLYLVSIALQPPAPAVSPPAPTFLPVQAATWVQNAVLRAVHAITDTGTKLAGYLPKAKTEPAPARPEPTYLEASLSLEDVDLEQLVRGLGVKLPFAVAGRISIQVQTALPINTAGDLKTYRFQGTATLPRLSLAGLNLEQVRARVRYAEGLLHLEELRGRLPAPPSPGPGSPQAGTFEGTAQVQVVPQGAVTGQLQIHGANLSVVQQLAPEFRPPVSLAGQLDVTAHLQGNLRPLTLHASGTATAAGLRLSDFSLNDLKFNWESDTTRLRVSNLESTLYGGRLNGAAVVPFQATVPGSAELGFGDLDVGILSKEVSHVPFRLEGRASGKVTVTLPAVEPGREREVTAETELQAPQLRVQGIPTQRLRGTVGYRQGVAEYHFEGETLGGRFRLDGRLPPPKPRPVEPNAEGRLRLEGARLARLGELLGGREIPLQGVVTLDLPFRHTEPEGVPVGEGRLTISRLRWNQTELAGTIQAEVRLTAQELRLRDLTGVVGQGLVRGQLTVNLRRPERSWFTLDADRVEASRLLAPWPNLASHIEGPLEARLRGSLGREWFGSGQVVLARGRVLGAEVNDWRLPLAWSFVPSRGRGRVEIRESSTQLARGRVLGQASLSWGAGSHVEGALRFFGVDLPTLLRPMTDVSQLGAGQLTGRLDFAGNEVRSLEDLTATLDATLAQTQAFAFPVLSQLSPYLFAGASSSAIFRSGDLRARLDRGVIRIQRLSLVGTLGQIFIDGTVTLSGRLALEVLANAGRLGVSSAGLRALGLRLPLAGPVPIALLADASTYLSNRLLHLRVTGTIRSPIVQIEPLSFVAEEALRFFVNRANLPLP